MATLTAKMVRELQGRTGYGLMACKQALERVDGDSLLAEGILKHQGCAIRVPNKDAWVLEQARKYKEEHEHGDF